VSEIAALCAGLLILLITARDAAAGPVERSPAQLRQAIAAANKPLAPAIRIDGEGELIYATCNLPQCSTLEFASFNLSTQQRTDLFDFPFDSFEDGYVADSLIIGGQLLVMSLQYDAQPSQGYLVTFNLTSGQLVDGFNSSQCFSVYSNPADPDQLYCLALEAACDGGQQCTELRHISRSARTDTLIASFLPNFAPYTVSCFDSKRALIYSTFGPLTSGTNVIAAINPQTGVVEQSVVFPSSTAYIELEYDGVSDTVYAVVEDTRGAFFGTVEPSTGVATPVSNASFFNTTYWNQFNTISTIAPELGVFFSTAFHYGVPQPPSDPILHLVGNSLATGAIVYDAVVQNPFCEILWLPAAPSAAQVQ